MERKSEDGQNFPSQNAAQKKVLVELLHTQLESHFSNDNKTYIKQYFQSKLKNLIIAYLSGAKLFGITMLRLWFSFWTSVFLEEEAIGL